MPRIKCHFQFIQTMSANRRSFVTSLCSVGLLLIIGLCPAMADQSALDKFTQNPAFTSEFNHWQYLGTKLGESACHASSSPASNAAGADMAKWTDDYLMSKVALGIQKTPGDILRKIRPESRARLNLSSMPEEKKDFLEKMLNFAFLYGIRDAMRACSTH